MQTKYVSEEELEPVKNPEAALKKQISILETTNEWAKQFNSCNVIRRITKFHNQVILQNGAYMQ